MLALYYIIYQYMCSITLCSMFWVIIKIVVTKHCCWTSSIPGLSHRSLTLTMPFKAVTLHCNSLEKVSNHFLLMVLDILPHCVFSAVVHIPHMCLTCKPYSCGCLKQVFHTCVTYKMKCGVAPIHFETGRYEGLTEQENAQCATWMKYNLKYR